MVQIEHKDQVTDIVLTPNRSASWAQNKLVMMALAFLILSIGIFWTLVGAWVILPFAFLEVGLVSYFLYRVSYNTHDRQVISIGANEVSIRSGVNAPTTNLGLAQPTHIYVEPPKRKIHALSLTLSDGTKETEIGTFLNKEDRVEALAMLESCGLKRASRNWWEN